jgi:hypothetical protein
MGGSHGLRPVYTEQICGAERGGQCARSARPETLFQRKIVDQIDIQAMSAAYRIECAASDVSLAFLAVDAYGDDTVVPQTHRCMASHI